MLKNIYVGPAQAKIIMIINYLKLPKNKKKEIILWFDQNGLITNLNKLYF